MTWKESFMIWLITMDRNMRTKLIRMVNIISSLSLYWILCFQMLYCKLVCFELPVSPKLTMLAISLSLMLLSDIDSMSDMH